VFSKVISNNPFPPKITQLETFVYAMKESTFMDFILDKHDEETVYNILNNVL
jgi:hypothetical protein